jgi:hypothetical protein
MRASSARAAPAHLFVALPTPIPTLAEQGDNAGHHPRSAQISSARQRTSVPLSRCSKINARSLFLMRAEPLPSNHATCASITNEASDPGTPLRHNIRIHPRD